MKYSKLFPKTKFNKNSDSNFISDKLLTQAGFIQKSTAGRYFFLPLGWRVHKKIENIIRKEMNKAGALEMLSPTLHPLELWQETNRTQSTGFELMTIKDRRGSFFALGGTAEEMFVDVVRSNNITYKDLPFNLYQFSVKFRDELRARGGLLRVREFIMKDAYSFHTDEKDFKKEYEKMKQTYKNIFKKLGLETIVVLADNGYIGGEYCHEFQVEHIDGEGVFFVSEDKTYAAHEDVAKFYKQPINLDEPEKPMQTIQLPAWVKTMDDNEKYHKKPKHFFLKNVVYKNINTGQIYVVVIRGDLEVNKTKLEHLVDAVGQLEEASEKDLEKIGEKRGFVHSWGNKNVIYVADDSLYTVKNFIGGYKTETTDTINVNYKRDFTCDIEGDVALAKNGYLSEKTHSKLIKKHGIEVGNIFQLGYHYSKRMKNATFVDKDGSKKPFYMGCYGIGIGRTLATIVEKHHDKNGIIWPKSVSPFDVHIISLHESTDKALDVYSYLVQHNIDVLWDDRKDISAGRKFKDADLIGIPLQIIISQRTDIDENIEIKIRKNNIRKYFSKKQVLEFIQNFYKNL